MGVFRVSKNQKSGKCRTTQKIVKQKLKPGGGGVEVLGGQKIKSREISMNCRENRYIFFNPPPRMERGRGGGEGERKRQVGREGGARAKPGNQQVYIYIWLAIPMK